MDYDATSYIFRVVTIGETAVGKTCLINRLVNDRYNDTESPTIGGNFLMHCEIIDGKKIEMQIWDTAGQEKYRSLSPIYCRDAIVAVIVYDVSKPETFEKLESWIQLFTEVADSESFIYIVGNKSDILEENSTLPEIHRKWAVDHGYDFAITSAKTGDGVEELFHEIALKLNATKITGAENQFDKIDINVEASKEKKSGCC